MKTTCQTCGGSGQINFFQGVSRFLLTTDECPACSGLGYVIAADQQASNSAAKDRKQRIKPDNEGDPQ